MKNIIALFLIFNSLIAHSQDTLGSLTTRVYLPDSIEIVSGNLDSNLMMEYFQTNNKEWYYFPSYERTYFGFDRPLSINDSLTQRANDTSSIVGFRFWNEYYWEDSSLKVNSVAISYNYKVIDGQFNYRGITSSPFYSNSSPINLEEENIKHSCSWVSPYSFSSQYSKEMYHQPLKSLYNENLTQMIIRKIKNEEIYALDTSTGDTLTYQQVLNMHNIITKSDFTINIFISPNHYEFFNQFLIKETYIINKEGVLEIKIESITFEVFNGEEFKNQFIVRFP